MRYTSYRFEVPEEKVVRVIISTDAKNEADDQFALVHALLSPKFDNVGFIAAHYGVERNPDSMEHSYQEIEAVFEKMGIDGHNLIFRGCNRPMKSVNEVIISDGTSLIIDEAMKDDVRPLYALFLGPLTDLASAYLQEPRIANRLTAIWIGGGAYPNGGVEFNLSNDIYAANVIFCSLIPLWQIPKNVFEMIPVSLAELQLRVYPYGEIGKYLFQQLNKHAQEDGPRRDSFRSGEAWVLGDSPAIGLLLYEYRYEYDWISAPVFSQDMYYNHTKQNRPIRVYKRIDSRLILEDFYAKLALFASSVDTAQNG